jgi:hypothetical protein
LFQNKYHSTFFKSIPKLTLYTQLFCFVYTTSIQSIGPPNLVRVSYVIKWLQSPPIAVAGIVYTTFNSL